MRTNRSRHRCKGPGDAYCAHDGAEYSEWIRPFGLLSVRMCVVSRGMYRLCSVKIGIIDSVMLVTFKISNYLWKPSQVISVHVTHLGQDRIGIIKQI
jgi:hypothetical protein